MKDLRRSGSDDWKWRDPDHGLNPQLRLKYEPGGWGDVLKGEWAISIVEDLRSRLNVPLTYVDPFAGARSYAITPAVRARLWPPTESSPSLRYFESQDESEIYSTAGLIERLCQGAWQPFLAEIDQQRRATWPACSDLSPEALLTQSESAHLVMWDPYDFHHHWSTWLPRLQSRARQQVVMIYLFNRAPQGVSQMRQYESLLSRLGREDLCLGRVPADARLPRAYHEVIVLGANFLSSSCRALLHQRTVELNAWLARQGCWMENRTGP
jgi:hypothetical protein